MDFTEFRLINFGLFAGEHVINVQPPPHQGSNERPIVLIGGKNGAGKTTLLEAVRLCLYGAAALGRGTKRATYEDYLRSRIHRQLGAPLQNTFAGVGVSFVHTIDGRSHTFALRRLWERKTQRVSETFFVERDGGLLNEQEMAGWDQFLHDLLPPGLADLFFFDGEKIQALADDSDYSLIGASIRSLLGFDLLDRLRADLNIYLARQRRSGGTSLDALLADLRTRRAAVEAEFAQTYAELGRLNSLIAHKQAKVEAAERLLASEGGDVAAQRAALKQRAEALNETLRRHERMVAEHANGLLPFALIPQLAHALRARLELDERTEHYLQVTTVADYFVEEFERRLTLEEEWSSGVDLNVAQRDKLITKLNSLVRAVQASLINAEDADLAQEEIVHPLEKEARREMMRWLDQATSSLPEQLATIGEALERASAELAAVELLRTKLPADEHTQPILQQLATLQRELGGLEQQQRTQEEALHQVRLKREALQREEQELYTRLMRSDDPSYRADIAIRAQQVLIRYETRLRQTKLGELERAIVACFGRLSRKGQYIKRVTIEPESFATTLYNGQGDPLPREQLSAGEKQIYAIAVLWALRIVSERTIPIIIDTPLGRLDSEHRQRLVQHYFPQASHQVVLLATDSEIDTPLYGQLKPAIARAYQLTYQPGEARSCVEPGYFWPEAEEHESHEVPEVAGP
ncbi:DNA sulfur modification protein DndD [Candidatus Viridilinea mediisalina]|uniref:Nuclease SbcCD subunit C n=1 Tax=Candidatus Viridilinea mediisalina TaxID=2024553 RepID=A0A2A6RKC2_9CHLR|nr:DNA sulfur modification protein DndD [Candidatus Viridilinea mediisalina]PDW03403.1 DNA sulfur modification protein DndD [Candidatus Viridilinea mediisalina]